MPIKDSFAIDHILVDYYSDYTFPLKVPHVAHSYEFPLISSIFKWIANIEDCVIEVNSQKSV